VIPGHHTLDFRADIQLLRGLAILLVFVFHLNSSALPAGFLGVDVFFVVSGFLMSALYGNTSGFNVWDFLTRRSRRILPAYFLTIICVLAFSFFTVLPHEFAQIANHSIYSSLLVANAGFWMDESYFNNAVFRPALHLWSLGVEIQFYVVFPVVLWAYARFPRTLLLICVLSLALCILVTSVSPKTSFFLLPFRLWEFMLGFYAAKALSNLQLRGTQGSYQWVAIGALGVLTVLPFASIPEAQHPAFAALLACGCTSVVLLLGLPHLLADSLVGRALVVLGKYSYSVYLVHFPVFAFYFYTPFGGTVRQSATALDAVILAGLTGLLSVALYHLVENPARRFNFRKGLATVHSVAALICLGIAVGAPTLQSMRFTPAQNAILNAWFDREEYRCGKLLRVFDPFPASCVLANPEGGASLLLVGNSHADALKASLRDGARRHGAGLRLMKANCSLGKSPCSVSDVVAEVLATGVDTVIVHDSPGSANALALAALVRAGTRYPFDVVLIDPVPVWGGNVPQALYLRTLNENRVVLPRLDLAQYRAANATFFDQVSALASPNFYRQQIAEAFCDPSCRLAASSGEPFYFDSSHLTLTGARRVEGAFESIFAFIERRRNRALTSAATPETSVAATGGRPHSRVRLDGVASTR
jgi:peptidoglycan/LPS O-acetylase OafA/YrhL